MYTSSRRGFTLIELLVVIAIIGILASIILASLNTARKKGRDARRIADMKQVQLALEMYYDSLTVVTYVPQGTPAIVAPGTPGASAMATALAPVVTANFIASIPTDPVGGTTYNYQYEGLDSASAACAAPGPCAGYLLVARLEAAGNSGTYIGTAGGIATTVCPAIPAAAPFPYCVKI